MPRGFRLPIIDDPQFSLVIDAVPDAEAALAVVVALAPLARSHAVELVVVDHGTGPASAGLATVAGLSYFLDRVDNVAMRLNHAAQCARGAVIVMFEPRVCSLADMTALLDRCSTSHWVFLRHAAVATAEYVGRRALQTAKLTHAAASFVALAVPNGIFHSVGGFAPHLYTDVLNTEVLHTDVGGSALDFAHRALTGGYRVQSLGNLTRS
jgi:hypothetical protein